MLSSTRLFMRSEFMRPREILLSSAIFGTVLILFLIGGALGPTTYVPHVTFAYNCGPEGDHVGAPCPPAGVELHVPNSTLEMLNDGQPLDSLNQFFGVAIAPYSVREGSFEFKYRISLNGYDGQGQGQHVGDLEGIETFSCVDLEKRNNRCGFRTVLGVPRIEYPYYEVEFSSMDMECTNGSCPSDWMRDVEFEANVVNPSYSRMAIGIKAVGAFMSAVFFSYYLIRMRDHWRPDITGMPDATLEQKFIALLLLALVLDNDPFYSLRLVTQGWFLDALSTIFQVMFDYILLLFWLGFADRTDRVRNGVSDLRYYVPKGFITLVWALLTFIALCWLRARHIFDPHIEQDPVYMTQIYPMLIATDIIYFLIIVYTVYLMVSTWEKINPKHYYLAFPTLVYIVSTLVAMFSGVTKDIETSSIAFLYYFALRNLYTYILLYGFWPATESSRQHVSNPIQTELGGEGQRLISHGSQKNPFK